jgi:hypothetical protein
MGARVSDLVVGTMTGLFGLLGLVMAAHARDTEIYIFGLGLAGFGPAFIFGQIRRHFDEQERAPLLVPVERERHHG